MYNLLYTAEAKKQIQKFSAAIRIQLKEAIEKIALDPNIGKSLTQELSGFMSFRSGDYRILYKIRRQELLVLIITVGHRKDIYQKAARKLS